MDEPSGEYANGGKLVRREQIRMSPSHQTQALATFTSETESGMADVGPGLGNCCLSEYRGSVWENGKVRGMAA